MEDVLRAIALLLIIEGLLPTVAPKVWRSSLEKLSQSSAQQLRTIGVISMIAGALLFRFSVQGS